MSASCGRLAGLMVLGALLFCGRLQAESELQIVSPTPGERVQQLQTLSVVVRSAQPLTTRTISLSVDGTVQQTLDTPAPWQELKLQWVVGERKPGTYALRISAVGARGVRAQSQTVRVVVEEAPWYPAPREDSYALLIGVGQYQDTGITSLSYSVADVKAIYRVLTDPAVGAYPPENVVMLTDESSEERKPTRSNILDLLKNWLGKVGQGADTVTVYFSGHGVEEDGRGYLVPRDARIGLLSDTGVEIGRVNELLQQTGARVKLLVVDACHSAAGKSVHVKMADAVATGLFSGGEGRATLASCKEDQRSWEWPEKGQSVFTYYLVDALQGKADANHDRQITLDEAFHYVHRRVTEWATENRKQQVPRLKADVSGEVVLAGMVPGKDPIRRPGGASVATLKPPQTAPATPVAPQAAAVDAPTEGPGTPDALAACSKRVDELAAKMAFMDALPFARQAVRLAPGSAETHMQLGRCLAYACRADLAPEAVREITLARQLDPTLESRADYHLHLARAYVNMQRWDDALPHARETIRLSPSVGVCWYALATILKGKGLRSEAAAAYRKCLELAPDDSSAANCRKALADLDQP